MKTLRHAACFLLVAISFTAWPACATSATTDQSDLWYIPAESGWGMQLVQRGNVIFATLFVYDPNNPTWYTATMDFTSNLTWTGVLYATTGTAFGLPWNPAELTVTPVGTMTWQAQTIDTGTLTYVVNGVTVVKNVTRQTLVLDDYSGVYLGTLHATVTGCTNPANDVPPTDIPSANFTITQSGQSISLAIASFGVTIIISGTLNQGGQFGTILGTYTVSTGEIGNASVSAMNVQVNALTASYSETSTNIGCQTTGYFAAMRSQQ